jgi:hypothetical protein
MLGGRKLQAPYLSTLRQGTGASRALRNNEGL